ncbi:retrovirus-related pol polyprotein from transposon TNT 1-94 [Tanacetum coccineum]
MVRMIRLRVMMIISYLALLFGYYVKKKHRCSYAYFAESSNCLFSSSTKWVIDSGASDHMTGNSHIFNKFDTHTSSFHVTNADRSISQVLGSGTVNLSHSISLSSVFSLPKFSFNLLSVSRITSNLQCSVKFYPEYYVFKDLKTKKIIGRGQKCDGLYVFEPEVSKSLVRLSSSSLFEAHCRLGHPSLQSLKKLCPEYSHLSSLNSDSCEFAKHKRVHLSPRANKRAASPFELVHSDVLRLDNAKEYFPETFQSYMLQHGILHESSCVYKPAQNGVAELKNHHLLEVARALLFQMAVPKPFWVDAVSTAYAPSEAYGESDAPSDAPNGSDSPPAKSPVPELDQLISLPNNDSILVPKTVGEALDHSGWRAAMIEEMNALDHNGTWALVDLPVHKKAIGCK